MMDPDDDTTPNDSDEGYPESTLSSFVTSIASDVRKGIEENGRVSPAYGQEVYGLPVDELEQERNDLQHVKFFLIMEDKLHNSPLPEHPSKILDVGCGSGIWAIDMADKYPSAQVIGVDIAPTQPSFVPPNCEFQIDDISREWLFPKNSFDLIHVRDLLFAMRDWENLIQQAKAALKPGGYIELAQTWPIPHSPDNSIPENSAYIEVLDLLNRIGHHFGAPLSDCSKWKDQLIAAGFEDVHERTYPLPISPWPKDERLKKIGVLEWENFRKHCDGFVMRGLTAMGRPPEEAHILAARARAELNENRKSMHVFLRL